MLHWANYSEHLAGYLHWGLNYWGSDPSARPSDRLPPGDTHVLYPGPSGPLSSIRWEIQRESLEDYEYLHLLTDQDDRPASAWLGRRANWLHPEHQAMEFCRQVVPSITDDREGPGPDSGGAPASRRRHRGAGYRPAAAGRDGAAGRLDPVPRADRRSRSGGSPSRGRR